jgi:hypothetical protein
MASSPENLDETFPEILELREYDRNSTKLSHMIREILKQNLRTETMGCNKSINTYASLYSCAVFVDSSSSSNLWHDLGRPSLTLLTVIKNQRFTRLR